MTDHAARDMAAAAAPGWGTPRHPPRPVGTGRARVFDVALADGRRIALRLHPSGDPDRAAVETRLKLAETLADAGFATPWPQRSATGALTHAVGGTCASALQWIAAPPTDIAAAGPVRAAMLRDLGALLADLHLTGDAVAPAGLPRPDHGHAATSAIAALSGHGAALGHAPDLSAADRACLHRATETACAALAALADHPTGLIHGDPTPDRVLRAPDGLYLIGVDRAGTGWRAQDLAVALWPHLDAPDLPHLRAALATGYVAGGGAATETASDRIGLFLTLRALAEAAATRPGDPCRPAALARALARARAAEP